MKKNQRAAKKRRSMNSKKCPVEIGNEYEVEITETTPNGSDIARIKDFLIFVNDAKPGSNLTIKITKIGSLSADGVIAE